MFAKHYHHFNLSGILIIIQRVDVYISGAEKEVQKDHEVILSLLGGTTKEKNITQEGM